MNVPKGNRISTRQGLGTGRKKVRGTENQSQNVERRSSRGKIAFAQGCELVKNDTAQWEGSAGNLDDGKLLRQPSTKVKIWWPSVMKEVKTRLSTSVPQIYSCTICGMACNNLVNLKHHKEYYSDPPCTCKLCGMKLSDKKQLTKHIRVAHVLKRESKFKLRCPFCGLFIAMLDHLRCHLYHFHKGWDDAYSNSSDSEAEMIKIATLAALEESEIKGNNSTSVLGTLQNNNSSTETLDGAVFGPTPREQKNSLPKKPLIKFTETKVSEILAPDSPVDFKNRFQYGEINIDDKSRVPIIDVDTEEPTKETSNIEHQLCDATTSALEEKETEKSFDGPKHPVKAKKTDTKRSAVESSEDDVVFIAKESKHVVAANLDRLMRKNKREEELRAFYSCKDCYIPLARVDVFDISKGNFKYRELDEAQLASIACNLCDQVFDTEADRQIHIEWRHAIIPSIVCNKIFRSTGSAHRHYREHHFEQKGRKTYCVCGMKFARPLEIRRHFWQYTRKVVLKAKLPAFRYGPCKPLRKRYHCKKCDAKFWLQTCLQYHRDHNCRPKPVNRKPQSDEPCMEVKVGKEYLRPAPKRKIFYCSTCGRNFSTAERLSRHEDFFACPSPHPCPICGTVFKGKRQVSSHIYMAHQEQSRNHWPYRCRICNHGFNKSDAERMHRMHHHQGKSVAMKISSDTEINESPKTDSDMSDDETTSKCNVCDLEFSSSKHFIDHLIYYDKNEIIECSICLEEFEGQYNAHHHNKLVHYSTDSRNALTHRCDFCQEGFMWKILLQAHLSHVHGIPAIEAQRMKNRSGSERKYGGDFSFFNVADTCKICDVSFASPVLLAAHEIENLNDGEFVCNKCSRRCRTPSLLLDHLSLNHASSAIQDGVKCCRCNENFQTPSSWVSHVKHFHFTNEPSEFYFEKNITTPNKHTRGWKFELIIPTNHSIVSGMSTLKMKGLLKSATAIQDICGSANVHNFIKLEEPDSTTYCSNSEECNGLAAKTPTIETPWKCSICAMNCSGPAEIERHAALYSDDGMYMCELCGRRFTWLHIYQEHRKKHDRSSCNQYFCQRCNEGFETLQCKISHDAHLHKISDGTQQRLPSIVPFTPSSANDRLRLREQGCEQNEQVASSFSLHTEIFEDELSTIYHCPNCHEKHPTLDGLNKHLAIVHNLKQDPIDDSYDDCDRFVKSVTCEICDMHCDSNDLLNIHRKAIHPSKSVQTQIVDSALVSEQDSTSISGRCCKSDLTHLIEKEKENGNNGLVNDKNVCKKIFTKRSNAAEKDSEYQSSITALNSPIQTTLQTSSVQSSAEGSPSTMIVSRESVGGTSNNVETEVADQFRCTICNIIFANKIAMRAHEVNVHCMSTIYGDQLINNSSNEESHSPSESSIQQLKRLVGALPIAMENVNVPAIDVDFETVILRGTRHDFNTVISESVESSESGETSNPSLSSDSDSLPSGNYKIAKLKVRSFATMIDESRVDESEENPDPPAKRFKQIFDPIESHDLCKQHRLEPPVAVASQTT